MRNMRTPLVAAVVVLLAATMVGCPGLFDGRAPVGEPEQYLQLEIAPAPGARAIEVTEYEVTSLVVQVNDPDGQLIHTIEWEAGEGRASHLLPVTRRGAYELVVTHYGELDGEAVEVTESAGFMIRASVITVVRVVPGSVAVVEVEPGEEPEESPIVGTWYIDQESLFYFEHPDSVTMRLTQTVTYASDGTFIMSGAAMSDLAGDTTMYGSGVYVYDDDAETLDLVFEVWEMPAGTPSDPPPSPTKGCMIVGDTMAITDPPGDFMWAEPLVYTRM